MKQWYGVTCSSEQQKTIQYINETQSALITDVIMLEKKIAQITIG